MKSKTLATWLALLGGGAGLHRLYLRSRWFDAFALLHLVGTLLGLIGWQRVRQFGLDDVPAWWLLPLGGLSITAGMLAAIVNGLQSDERFNARYNGAREDAPASGWANVIGVGLALLVGAIVLMSTITVSLQRWFELHG